MFLSRNFLRFVLEFPERDIWVFLLTLQSEDAVVFVSEAACFYAICAVMLSFTTA